MKQTKSKKALEIIEAYNTVNNKVLELNKQKKALRDQVLDLAAMHGSTFKAGKYLAQVLDIESFRFSKDKFLEENTKEDYNSYCNTILSSKITIKAS